MTACTRERLWYYYIVASLVTFFGGLFFIIPARLIWYACYATPSVKDGESYRNRRSGMRRCCARMRASLLDLVQGHTPFSRALIVFFWLVNMAAVMLYLVEATMYTIENCGDFKGEPTQYTWLAFNIVFLIHYILRVLAAPDKLNVWLDIYSIVDHFTIPHIFMGIYLDNNWIGFKFLRMMYLLQTHEILEILYLIKTRNRIRLIQIVSIFMACWFASSGFVFLTENNGDPFHNYENGAKLTYWECVYWLLVTMSTVGFGEISPSTDTTRAFIVLFIIGSFAMFTSIIPELAKSLGRSSKYTKPYKRVFGKKHVVVCGNINYDTVCSFIRNFIHEDADTKDIDVVFLHNTKPNLELEAFFKRHSAGVSFIQGSVMDIHSCQMVKMKDSDAVLILADRSADDPDEEDIANIMRATAVKNFHPAARVIIQLLQQKHKPYLLQIPNFKWHTGDDVICISEFKLGIMGQNCLAPGFSTLISNLFTNRSYKRASSVSEVETNYRYGCGHEIYVEQISPVFDGMTFQQVTEICFAKMNVLLLGVDHGALNRKRQVLLNPGNDFIVNEKMRGYMIAQSPEDAQKLTYYQGEVEELSNGGNMSNNNLHLQRGESPSKTSEVEVEIEYLQGIGYRLANYGTEKSCLELERSPPAGIEEPMGSFVETFDFSGLFHWCATRSLDEIVLSPDNARDFCDHVVVCMLTDSNSPAQGLINLIMPLRSSSLRKEQLKDVVIIGNVDYMKKEWNRLMNFPQIWMIDVTEGHTAARWHMRFANINRCSMCVILSASKSVQVDGRAVDKDAVLTTLNVRNLFLENIEDKIQGLGKLTNVEEFRKHTAVYGDIPYITELENESDVMYMDQDDEDDPSTPLYLTTPYMAGRVFADNVLDSLASCTYLNRDVLTLTRALINGVENTELELLLGEGMGFSHQNQNHNIHKRRNKCHIGQYPLCNGPLETVNHGHCYGELFILALRHYGLLCLGVHRELNPTEKDPRNKKRYVITHPPFHFGLLPSDKVFVLEPFDDGKLSRSSGSLDRHSRTSSGGRRGSIRPTTAVAEVNKIGEDSAGSTQL